jgi:hypothetical protein
VKSVEGDGDLEGDMCTSTDIFHTLDVGARTTDTATFDWLVYNQTHEAGGPKL